MASRMQSSSSSVSLKNLLEATLTAEQRHLDVKLKQQLAEAHRVEVQGELETVQFGIKELQSEITEIKGNITELQKRIVVMQDKITVNESTVQSHLLEKRRLELISTTRDSEHKRAMIDCGKQIVLMNKLSKALQNIQTNIICTCKSTKSTTSQTIYSNKNPNTPPTDERQVKEVVNVSFLSLDEYENTMNTSKNIYTVNTVDESGVSVQENLLEVIDRTVNEVDEILHQTRHQVSKTNTSPNSNGSNVTQNEFRSHNQSFEDEIEHLKRLVIKQDENLSVIVGQVHEKTEEKREEAELFNKIMCCGSVILNSAHSFNDEGLASFVGELYDLFVTLRKEYEIKNKLYKELSLSFEDVEDKISMEE